MVPPTSGKSSLDFKDLLSGAILQCVEAATLGMPFEVWKTRMGRFRNETSLTALVNIYTRGGLGAYWQGTTPKMIESASKGSILLFSKEALFGALTAGGLSATSSGFVAGAGAGVCQTIVISPCTFIVTAIVTNTNAQESASQAVVRTIKTKGIRGFYPGGTAVAFRQATNWASRQGLTEFIRENIKKYSIRHSNTLHIDDVKLTKTQEVAAGILGGAMSTWNQPFEVARIHMQAASNEGKDPKTLIQVFRHIIQTDGPTGMFKGIVPRIGLGIWQTLFMVTGAKMMKEHMNF